MSRIQYADDTSLYSHCRVKNLPDCLSSISANLANLNAWSSQSNLALNPKKTEAMLFSTSQMASVHSLGELDLSLNISGNTLKRVVFDPLPLYLVKRLQRIQNAATSFVIGRYATTTDAVKIGWLPVHERREWHLLKTTYKALHDTSWPSYASLEVAKPLRNLRSSDSTKLTVPRVKGIFQDLASKYFNKLPNDIKNCETLVSFSIQSKNYLMDIAKERLQ